MDNIRLADEHPGSIKVWFVLITYSVRVQKAIIFKSKQIYIEVYSNDSQKRGLGFLTLDENYYNDNFCLSY